MPSSSYAPIIELKEVILERRVISFLLKKRQEEGEPHFLGIAKRTGAYVVMVWMRGKSPRWQLLRYPEIRDMNPLNERFEPREDAPWNHLAVGEIVVAAR